METNKNKYGYKQLNLLKNKNHKIRRVIFSRLGFITLSFLIQLAILVLFLYVFDYLISYYIVIQTVFVFLVSLYLINSDIDATAKITWLAIILVVPVFGCLLLWYTRSEIGHKLLKKKYVQTIDNTRQILLNDSLNNVVQDVVADESLKEMNKYIASTGTYNLYNNTLTKYFRSGKEYFASLMDDLSKAKKYILIEYFIIDEGIFWGSVLNKLVEKAREGVEVKILYDGTCEFASLNHKYPQMLKEYGIDAVMFAPITPFMSTHYNYRDHRKIVVIDGIISYTGGINLADEYIDEKIRFGKWVDSGIRFEGEATKDFIYMFYQMYTTSMGVMDLEKYLLSIDEIKIKSDSVVMPFGDCPIDSEKICENIIIDTLYKAKKYVHITTPYLILDQELENALCFTAKRGIDVVIIVPGVPDKKIPYILAKTHYKKLITAGVKIYECNGSFVHAKDWIADDTFAMCGSVNLDYRSLYHHFECGACIYNDKTILDMNNHFNDILSQSTQVSIDSIKKRKIITKVLGVILKILAPLL